VSIDHMAKHLVALIVIGISGGTLGACSGPTAAPAPTWHPGVGKLTIKLGPPLTERQAAQLVRKGCDSVAEVDAAVAGVTATDGRGSNNAFQVLFHGPWYTVISIEAASTFPEFTRIAANAKALDLATIASLNGAGLTGVADSVTKLSGNCKSLGLPTG